MEQFLAFVQPNLTAIVSLLVFVGFYIFAKENTVLVIKWIAGVATEQDGNGGKASAARVIGFIATYNIVVQSYGAKPPAEMLWDVFMVSIGYAFLSKAMSTVSPAIIDLAKGYMNKHSKVEATKP